MTPALRSWLGALLLAVVIGAALPASAFAQTYARGGVLLDWSQDTRFKDADCASTTSAALYGCGTGNDGAPRSSHGNFGVIPGLEIGLGYAIVPALRLEAAVQYRPDFSFDGRANFKGGALDDRSARQDVAAELSSLSGMLTAYLDISELLLFQYKSVGPFIGVGGGLSRIEIGETRMDFPKTSTIVPGGEQVNFSWMLTAGLSISLSPRLMLDVGWRYTDHGTIETASGEGRVVCGVAISDNCKAFNEQRKALNKKRQQAEPPLPPLPLVPFPLPDLAKTKGDLRSHGVIVSLRYAF